MRGGNVTVGNGSNVACSVGVGLKTSSVSLICGVKIVNAIKSSQKGLPLLELVAYVATDVNVRVAAATIVPGNIGYSTCWRKGQ